MAKQPPKPSSAALKVSVVIEPVVSMEQVQFYTVLLCLWSCYVICAIDEYLDP
jgi:hypothetical protein